MSTKTTADSKKLEDLTREVEVEQDQDATGDKQEDQKDKPNKDNRDRRSSSEVSQVNESTIPKKPARRTRTKVDELKSKPKRRKTSESEHSDLSENTTSVTNDNESVAGPSSAIGHSSKGVHTAGDGEKIQEDRVEEEMDAETSDEISPPIDRAIPESYVRDIRAENDINDSSDAQGQQGLEEDAPTSSSYRLAEKPHDDHSMHKTVASNIHRQRFTPPNARSAVLEEIFRMPIFESDSRRSVFEAEGRFEDDEDNDNYALGFEIPGLSRPVRDGPLETRQNHGPEEQGDAGILLQEKQRMMWARKIFFRSTELIFPGFARYADAQSKRKECMAVRVRSSWILQALLYADLLFFIMWFLAFLSTFDIAVTVLKELHGNLVLCMTALFSLVNIPRLLFGLKGNENDKMEFLALFWMMTFIVQAPLFGFILFTDVFTPIRLAFTLTMDGIMMVFILLEVIVGTIHLKDLIRDELKVIELAKQSEHVLKGRQGDSNLRPRVINTVDGPVVNWIEENEDNEDEQHGRRSSVDHSDDDWSTDESVEEFSQRALGRDPAVDYRLKIRRLRTEELEEPERDDNQVSSTSDSLRQRQLGVI